jgi:hypothetical protein
MIWATEKPSLESNVRDVDPLLVEMSSISEILPLAIRVSPRSDGVPVRTLLYLDAMTKLPDSVAL